MNNKTHIEDLLHKFYNAELSEREEQELREALRLSDDKELTGDRNMLNAFENAKSRPEYPEELDARLDKLIGDLERKERHSAGLRRKIIWTACSAAALAALAALAFGMLNLFKPDSLGPQSDNIRIVTNPQEAKQLLDMVDERYTLLANYCESEIAKSDSTCTAEFEKAMNEISKYDEILNNK